MTPEQFVDMIQSIAILGIGYVIFKLNRRLDELEDDDPE